MRVFGSKGAVEFETIIVLTLAVLVLLLVGAFFTGGFKSLSGKTMDFSAKSSGSSSSAGKVINCERLCNQITGCAEAAVVNDYLENDCDALLKNGCSMEKTCVSCTPYPECEALG